VDLHAYLGSLYGYQAMDQCGTDGQGESVAC